jgi:hypothetical protein
MQKSEGKNTDFGNLLAMLPEALSAKIKQADSP